jgi:hypothetical protein
MKIEGLGLQAFVTNDAPTPEKIVGNSIEPLTKWIHIPFW